MKFLTVNPDAIPATMRNLAHWVQWSAEPGKNGKDSKEPFRAGSRFHARSTDKTTWARFESVLHAMSNSSARDGIGFVLTESGVVFVDLDHVRNPETGVIAPWAQAVINEVNSYTEVSPTSTGVHIYALGTLPGRGLSVKFADNTGMEVYCTGRYTTVTGHSLPGTPDDLQPRDAQVQSLYQRLKQRQLGPGLGAQESVQPESELESVPESEPSPAPATAAPGSVRDLLDKFGLVIKAQEPYQGDKEVGTRFVLEACPFYPPHRDSAVFDYPSGVIFHCLHDSCADKTWRHVCSLFEYQAPGVVSWRQQLICDKNAKPKALLANAVLFLRHSPEWKGVLSLNQFSLYTVALKPAPWSQSVAGKNWTDFDDSMAACWLQQQGVQVNSRVTAEAVQTVARESPFHPVREYLRGLTWDGVKRTADWLAIYLGVNPSPLNSAIGERWHFRCGPGRFTRRESRSRFAA